MAADGLSDGLGLQAGRPVKMRAAGLSIGSNVTLIALKVVAGAVTGSVAILTEAMHSAIDLVASIVAWFSVRKADIPADEEHRYGHYKLENLAAAIEGILILVGSGVIAFEAIRKLVESAPVERLGFGIAVMAVSGVANLAVSTYLYRQARLTESPALAGDAAHLRTDAITSMGVLVALALVAITGVDELDPIAALVVAVAIVFSGVRLVTRSSRVLVDEVLPDEEMTAVQQVIQGFGAPELIGFHKVRARRGGSRRYVDLHVQFRRGTSLERAHDVSHQLQSAIRDRLGGADVLIHLEPEDAADAPAGDGRRSGLSAG
ncbi:MAG: cation diffusion facilitator family transporter [Solirubrobacteraceae bacterium]